MDSYENMYTNGQLYKIYGWVKREEIDAKKMKDEIGEVPIKNEHTGEILDLINETEISTLIDDGCILVSV